MFIRDLINRQTRLTGKKLLDALELAGRPPAGGAGVEVQARGAESVIRSTGAQIIPRRALTLILGSATTFASWRWEYHWTEGSLNGSNEWVTKSGGKSSADPGRRRARNYAEVLNTLPTVLYGIQLSQPDITVEIFAIPPGAVVPALEVLLPGGDFAYWFLAVNRIDVECTGPLITKKPKSPRGNAREPLA
jgi:hypothetical protein